MSFRHALHTLFGVVLLGVIATSSIGALTNAKTTYFTFGKAVQLPGVALPAGTYIFEVVNSNSSSDVVRVMSRDRSRTYLLQITIPTYRLHTRDLGPSIVFGEQPAGQPSAVKAWFPDSETLGRQFIY